MRKEYDYYTNPFTPRLLLLSLLCILVLALLVFFYGKRARDFRRAIMSIETETHAVTEITPYSDCVTLIGKPNTDYHTLPTTPTYRDFWEAYEEE